MEKAWLIGLIGLFILLISYIVTGIVSEPPGFVIEEQAFYEERIEASGIDKDLLIPTQMQPIAENELTYVKTFQKEDYTGQSTGSIIFSRNWGSPLRVDWDNEAAINPDVYLFENGEHYYKAIATFTMPYSFNTAKNILGYLDIKHSNNFYVSVWYGISYIEDGEEYRIQSGTLPYQDESPLYPIYQNQESIYDGFNKELIYTFIISFSPTEDNDLDVDMYLSADFDFYFKNDSEIDSIKLGFNEFKITDNTLQYSPVRKTVRYRKEH